jgi:aryl-alcohol dehydrogenase-like predicted oxidoreductase
LLGAYGETLYRTLLKLRDEGKVKQIGVSIYDPEELDRLCPLFQFDIVQAPFNVIDRRLSTSGWLERLQKSGCEVHVRSIFLQGLLLMDAASRPAGFNRWQILWDHWHDWLNAESLTPLQASLGHALARPEVSRIVIGVDSLQHLQEILASCDTGPGRPPDTLISKDPDLINPSRWNTL